MHSELTFFFFLGPLINYKYRLQRERNIHLLVENEKYLQEKMVIEYERILNLTKIAHE